MKTLETLRSDRLREWGITVLRLVIGFVFVMHGGQKWFVNGIDAVAEGFGSRGLPLPMVSAVLVASAEFGGGLLLILGLLTRLATIPLMIVMLVAMFHVHWKNGFFLPGGIEFTFTLLGGLVALLFLGGGPLSLDRLLFDRSRRKAALGDDRPALQV